MPRESSDKKKKRSIMDIDLEITKIVFKNARMSFSEIARQLSISPQMAIRRYNNLKGTAFSRSSIAVNLKKLGFKASVGFNLTIKEEKHREIHEIYDEICNLPNVIVAIRTFGSRDMAFVVPVRDFEELFQFQEHIYKIDGIEKIDVTIYRPHENWPPQVSDKFMQQLEKIQSLKKRAQLDNET
jgi:Lrp/AsnC family transcriptional regulator, regulator for asnA, asnC and gidA